MPLLLVVCAGKSSKHRVGGVLQIAAVIGYGSGQYKITRIVQIIYNEVIIFEHVRVAFLSKIATDAETPFCRPFQELKRTSIETKYLVKHSPHRWIKDLPWLAEDSQ